MKAFLVLLFVVGVAIVSANPLSEEEYEEKLETAIKSLLQGEEELKLASRDTLGGCMRATNNCNGHGQCVQGSWGGYYCRCTMPYRVGGTESSCYSTPATPESEKEEIPSNLKMEILKRLIDLILKK